MGWTSYHANYYKKNGTVDRKKEMDAYFLEGLNAGMYEVVKSAMVGSTYYAAVKQIQKNIKNNEGEYVRVDIPENEQKVYGYVFLTKTDMKDYYNIYYKDMSEDMGPYESECPVSIIKLLSQTDHEYALAWRKRCLDNAQNKNIKNCPVGTIIEFENWNGETIQLVKMNPAYQFKTVWWRYRNKNMYFTKKDIPWDRVTVVTE